MKYHGSRCTTNQGAPAIFERVLPKKCCFDDNKKITHILTFLDKYKLLRFYVWSLMTGAVQMGHKSVNQLIKN